MYTNTLHEKMYVSAANENYVEQCNVRNGFFEALLLAMIETTEIMLAETIASIKVKATCRNDTVYSTMDTSTVLE